MAARLRDPLKVVRAFLGDVGLPNQTPSWSDDYIEPFRLWEVVVPADEGMRAKLSGRPHFFGTADPFDPDIALASDVLTFFPIPLSDWQEVADRVLEEYASGWRNELRRIQTELQSAVMYTLPFAQIVVGAPGGWVTIDRVEVDIVDYLEDWGKTETKGRIAYVKRPYIVWPRGTDSSTHLTMVVSADNNVRPLSIVRPPLAYDELTPDNLRPSP